MATMFVHLEDVNLRVEGEIAEQDGREYAVLTIGDEYSEDVVHVFLTLSQVGKVYNEVDNLALHAERALAK